MGVGVTSSETAMWEYISGAVRCQRAGDARPVGPGDELSREGMYE